MTNIKDYIAIANDYHDDTDTTSDVYTEDNCWLWAEQRAEKTIYLIKDVMDNTGCRLTDEALNELWERLVEDYYTDVYVPSNVYSGD